MDVQQALLKEWEDIRRASAQTVALGLGDDIGAGRIDSRYVAAMGDTVVKIGMAYWAGYGAALLAPMLLPEAPAWATPFVRAGTGALAGTGARGGSDLVDQRLSSVGTYLRSAEWGVITELGVGIVGDFAGGVVAGYKGEAQLVTKSLPREEALVGPKQDEATIIGESSSGGVQTTAPEPVAPGKPPGGVSSETGSGRRVEDFYEEAQRRVRESAERMPSGGQRIFAMARGNQRPPIWSATKTKSAVENAIDHFLKHRLEFPELQNSLQYVAAARRFVDSPPAGTLVKLRPTTGELVLYEPATNTFAVRATNGAPKTMFRPNPLNHKFPTNLDYFNAQ